MNQNYWWSSSLATNLCQLRCANDVINGLGCILHLKNIICPVQFSNNFIFYGCCFTMSISHVRGWWIRSVLEMMLTNIHDPIKKFHRIDEISFFHFFVCLIIVPFNPHPRTWNRFICIIHDVFFWYIANGTWALYIDCSSLRIVLSSDILLMGLERL